MHHTKFEAILTHFSIVLVVPSEPREVSISTVYGYPTLLSLSWKPPLTPNGVVTIYTVYCKELPETFDSSAYGSGEPGEIDDVFFPEFNATLSLTLLGDVNATLFPDLAPYTNYSCYVSASTSAGEGNFSIGVIARTDESGGSLSMIYVCRKLNMTYYFSSLRCPWESQSQYHNIHYLQPYVVKTFSS